MLLDVSRMAPIVHPNDIDLTLKKPKFYLPFITLLIVFYTYGKRKKEKSI